MPGHLSTTEFVNDPGVGKPGMGSQVRQARWGRACNDKLGGAGQVGMGLG